MIRLKMINKKYPELYERIKQYVTLVAYDTFVLPADAAEEYIRRDTPRRYRCACKLINHLGWTVEQCMAEFPLD